MNFYGAGHFDTTYSLSYTGCSRITEPQIHNGDYDFFHSPDDCASPYSSNRWTTSYRSDYGLTPK